MISTENGKLFFYQWDINQRLIIDGYPEGAEVHFSLYSDYCCDSLQNADETCLVVETYVEGERMYANIPNILLQSVGKLYVYVYVTNNNGSHTDDRMVFKVCRRERPSSYVYTETEIKCWRRLEEKILNIESQLIHPDNATENMTQPVGVDEDGRLWTTPAIETATIEELKEFIGI